MSLQRLPIVYITGHPACGKTTISKWLADSFGLYHISMSDLRRAHLASIRAGVPWVAEPIRKYVKGGKIIPQHLLEQYEAVPAVLQYYNHITSGNRNWTTEIASAMLNEEITRVSVLAQSEGKYKGIILDEHPLPEGTVSEDLVAMYKPAGITIVIESSRKFARQRYLERVKILGENEERFNQRMKSTDRVLPRFIELMEGFGDIVRWKNDDDTMFADQVYRDLRSGLNKNNAWLTFTKQN
ncbi:P-loop containing nucleoside triphosphate hydrolase protein [Xylaria acuta]|nr:P-loop containing nucleoside triphosphate hydrolase protein [Xylaria acuta]